jgi:hypothetical protein
MTWVVVAFLLLGTGEATFYKSGTFSNYDRCEFEARNLILSIDRDREEITIFASDCIENDDRHYPGENET